LKNLLLTGICQFVFQNVDRVSDFAAHLRPAVISTVKPVLYIMSAGPPEHSDIKWSCSKTKHRGC